MEFPIIVIDSINNSIKGDDDDEYLYNEQTQKGEYPYLGQNSLRIQTNSNNDDGDSGIHESNEVLGPSPVPSHRMLIEQSPNSETGSELMRCKRCLSASCLIERKRSFSQSFTKASKNRNFSIDTGRPSNIQIKKSFSPYKLVIVDEEGKAILVQKVSRDSVKSLTRQDSALQNERKSDARKRDGREYRNDLCQIHLLLIIMKIVLGGAVTIFGIFLKGFSSSLDAKDCGYWASSLLLVSGLVSIYFVTESLYFENKRYHNIYLVLAVTISLCSSILCMIASVHSGVHGNWISFHADDCTSKKTGLLPDNEIICCIDATSDPRVLSVINWHPLNNSLVNQSDMNSCSCIKESRLQRRYVGFTCNYLFSSLKDYFVLICSLMAVASGCEVWFVVYLLRYRCTATVIYRNPGSSENYRADVNIGFTHTQLPSPIIPAVLFPQLDRSQS